jgi:hypothetical protein
MLAIMEDGVNGRHRPAMIVQRFAGIGIRIKTGEVAAGDVKPDAVAFLEHICRWVKFDGEGIDGPWFHEFLFGQRFAEAGANDAVFEI